MQRQNGAAQEYRGKTTSNKGEEVEHNWLRSGRAKGKGKEQAGMGSSWSPFGLAGARGGGGDDDDEEDGFEEEEEARVVQDGDDEACYVDGWEGKVGASYSPHAESPGRTRPN